MTVPALATTKLAALQTASEDAFALASSAKKAAGDCRDRLQSARNGRSEADIARAAQMHEAALDLQQARFRRYETAEQLVTRVRSWLEGLQGTQLELAPVPTVAMNGAPSTAVASLRAEIATLAAEHFQIRTAPAPLADAKAQVRALVEMLGRRGRPMVQTQFGELKVHGWDAGQTFGPASMAAVIEFAAWLDPEQMIARLDEAIASQSLGHPSDLPEPLPIAERAARLSEIEAEIALLEGREEHLIEQAAKDGIVIERRHDQSPASILQVRIAVTSMARAAA